MKTICSYKLSNGKIPFQEWLNSLDKPKKAKVLVWIERLKIGLYGSHRNLKLGISELKFESGERIYFYEDKQEIVLLLTAGNKQRQANDIKTAESYLKDYKERGLR
ncbi:MAG: type II toxin-antitoxin system RelE/ParE family toxin [Muribaculaceae bacterium]|nr:type II toxin-antitoxin system RelE/ParE family toxin [Muribaculaceae bacterium]